VSQAAVPVVIVACIVACAFAFALARRASRAAEKKAAAADEAQRLLRTVIDTAPTAIVLLSDAGRIVLANTSACDYFAEGNALDGQNFLKLLGNAPPPFREAMLAQEDALFTVGGENDGEAETFRLTKRQVKLDASPHTLLMVEQVTRELRRQEVDVWKKLLRTISHELNNSLAPISSLVHSARVIAGKPEAATKLVRVFDTIEDRTRHLTEFLESYVRFARLPKPRHERIVWTEFLGRIREMFPDVKVENGAETPAWFDAGQMEQVVLNLLKNAEESGSAKDAIELAVVPREKGSADLVVRDRGPGMSDEVLASALLPFYSTKKTGTGLGLALCREIVEAHGGKVRLQNREGGGLEVTCTLLGREAVLPSVTGRLTLTHA
jgi:two-component system, NtrC family, nitrogen regulation sensor histidine kinase NtrY